MTKLFKYTDNWQNQFKAFQEFVENYQIKFEYLAYNGKHGVCVEII